MKKAFLVPALLLAAAATAHAQNNVVKVDIIRPIFNTLLASYEHKLSETSSFQLGLGFTSNFREDGGFISGSLEGRQTSGFQIMPEYRFYLSEKTPAMEGFYVAPFVRYEYLNQTGDYYFYTPVGGGGSRRKYEASLSSFGLGAVVGRHWIFKQRFSLDLHLGPSYTTSTVSSDFEEVNRNDFLGYTEDFNYGLRGGISFGLAF